MDEFLLAQTHDAVSFLTLVAAYCLVIAFLVSAGMRAEDWWKDRRKAQASSQTGRNTPPENGSKND